MKEYFVLKGTALRREFADSVDEMKAGFTLPEGQITLRHFTDEVFGYTECHVTDDGDLAVTAWVDPLKAYLLIGSPYLAVAASVREDEPAKVHHIMTSPAATDPFQLPYRIVDLPEGYDLGGELMRDYRRVMVIDEPHEVEFSIDVTTKGYSWEFDETKSHHEWQHRQESKRALLPDSIARGFGFDSWADLKEGEDLAAAKLVLGEVIKLL